MRAENYKNDPIAISTKFLKRKKWYTGLIANINVLVLTDRSNAARVFDIKDKSFSSYKKWKLDDQDGQIWSIQNDKLVGPQGESFQQIPSHNIFWFTWYNAYPETRLIK